MVFTQEKKWAALLSIISNTGLIMLKVIAGLLSGSISIISEAMHSFSDLLASFLAFFSVSYSAKPADIEHPFGHGKYEDFSGLIEGFLIILVAFYIIFESVKKIISGSYEIINTPVAMAVMFISVVVNIFVSWYLFKVAKKTDSVALFADAEHLRTDVYSSCAVFLGLLAIKVFGLPILDPIIAIVVAFIILFAGCNICKISVNNLLDATLPEADLEVITSVIKKYSDTNIELKNLKTRKAGNHKNIIMTILVNPDMTVFDSHNLCDEIEKDITQSLNNTYVVIHTEPLL